MERVNIFIGTGLFIFCAAIFIYTYFLHREAAIFPRFIIISLGILSIIIVVKNIINYKKIKSYIFSMTSWKSWIIIVASSFFYVYSATVVGLYFSTFLFILLISIILSKERSMIHFMRSLAISLSISVVLYILFYWVLKVLPPPSILL